MISLVMIPPVAAALVVQCLDHRCVNRPKIFAEVGRRERIETVVSGLGTAAHFLSGQTGVRLYL